jgi:phosphatidate phosphatase APP1
MIPEAMAVAWIFPSVISVRGGCVRGRTLRKDPDRGRNAFIRNTRSIVFTSELPLAPVRLEVCGRTLSTRSDDEGFFAADLDASIEAPLPLGPQPVTAYLGDDPEAPPAGAGTLLVVPEDGLSVVSDFDDTIAVSHIGRTIPMLWNALLRDDTDHRVVDGMAALYRRLASVAAAFHYVSGTPVGLLRRTERFLARHEFPPGAVLLRHFETDGFDTFQYKPRVMAEIARALPRHRFLFVGDSSEKDPEVFAGMRHALGDRMVGALVRRVTRELREASRFAGMFVFDDVEQAATEVVRLGIITPH